MKVSLNSIKSMNQRYGCAGDPAPEGVEKLAQKIGAQLGAIEEIIDFGTRYEDILIVKVVSCIDHPNADRLHVCKVDDGGKAANVERDEQGYIQVVCGAPNVRVGMLAAWLPPGSIVPSTVNKDPFVLEARDIRGQKSNGMMASPRELGLGDNHEGILEISEDVAPGTSFAQQYDLSGDYIFDIENKMFTHRPDCFGFLGVAREIAGIQHQPFTSPDWYKPNVEIPGIEANELKLEVRNEIPEIVPRFTAITMRDVNIGPSPVWLQIALTKAGLRPINNIVDLTNFFMLETGQPLHAYDYDKVKAQDATADHATIIIRYPKPNEKIRLLNGKEIEPRAEAIMIATNDKPIGLGGVMGGSETEVDQHTKNIIIECANFDMYSIRRTSMAHGLFTDAVTRFTKGQSALQNKAVLAKIVDDVRRLASGKIASILIDDNRIGDRAWIYPPVPVTTEFINSRLGFRLSADEMKQLLENVEFQVATEDDSLTVTAPFWRTDIETREDIVEEVGRLYGYDHLPLELPVRDFTPTSKDPLLELKSAIRRTLSSAGANEVLTYSFVHGNLLDKVSQDKSKAFQVANALSPDLQYYRLSLTPSLLEKVHSNIKSGYDQFALFEIGKSHTVGEPDPEEPDIPKEVNALSLIFASKQAPAGAPYYAARKYLDALLATFQAKARVKLDPLAGADLQNNPWIQQMVAPFEPNRAAIVRVIDDPAWDLDLIWGIVGEFKASVRQALKLPDYCAGFELDPLLFLQKIRMPAYMPISRFPKLDQDICLRVPADMPYEQVAQFVSQQVTDAAPENSRISVEPLDIYKREADQSRKQITFRVSIASYERTLTDAEVAKILGRVAEAAKEQLNAERV